MHSYSKSRQLKYVEVDFNHPNSLFQKKKKNANATVHCDGTGVLCAQHAWLRATPTGRGGVYCSRCNECPTATHVTVPSNISNAAFQFCTGLIAVNIAEGVTSIGVNAFWGCTNLKTVTIASSVSLISTDAFWGCAGLQELEIPEGVQSIGSNAFHGCSSLTTVAIPSTVKTIGGSAFMNCSSLSKVILPETVSSILY